MTIPTESQEKQVQTPVDAVAQQKEQNFSQLRRQLEQEKTARLAAEQRASQLERSRSSNSSSDEEDVDTEPYVDHRKLEKKFKKFEMSMEEKIDKRAEEKARQIMEVERQTNYLKQNNDFDQIMKEEHIQKFADKYPALAEKILRMPDGFERQTMVYENIKALGLHKKEAVPSVQEKIDANRRNGSYQPSGIATPPGMVGIGGKNYTEAEGKSAFEKIQQLKKNLRL